MNTHINQALLLSWFMLLPVLKRNNNLILFAAWTLLKSHKIAKLRFIYAQIIWLAHEYIFFVYIKKKTKAIKIVS